MNSNKILVLSDTHGDIPALIGVLKWAKSQPFDAAVFLGDGVQDMSLAMAATGFSTPVKMVRGNSDHALSIKLPETALLDFAGHIFFLCHGHHYSLHGDFDTLIAAGRNNKADAALFGHTHIPFHKTINGFLLVNPGSIGRPRGKTGATFAVIECLPDTQLAASFWVIGEGNMPSKLPSV